jgi:hypothetical protein
MGQCVGKDAIDSVSLPIPNVNIGARDYIPWCLKREHRLAATPRLEGGGAGVVDHIDLNAPASSC